MGHHLGNDVLVRNTVRIHTSMHNTYAEQIEYYMPTTYIYFRFLSCIFLKGFFFMKYYSFFCSIHNQMIQKEGNKQKRVFDIWQL